MVSRLSAQAGAAAREAAAGLRNTSSARSVGSDADEQVRAPRRSLRQLNAECETKPILPGGVAPHRLLCPQPWF
jgi:hypothetical protein